MIMTAVNIKGQIELNLTENSCKKANSRIASSDRVRTNGFQF